MGIWFGCSDKRAHQNRLEKMFVAAHPGCGAARCAREYPRTARPAKFGPDSVYCHIHQLCVLQCRFCNNGLPQPPESVRRPPIRRALYGGARCAAVCPGAHRFGAFADSPGGCAPARTGSGRPPIRPGVCAGAHRFRASTDSLADSLGGSAPGRGPHGAGARGLSRPRPRDSRFWRTPRISRPVWPGRRPWPAYSTRPRRRSSPSWREAPCPISSSGASRRPPPD